MKLQMVKTFYPNVTNVKDAKRNLIIEVNKRDVNNKAVKNHKECAIAVACKRQFNGAVIGRSISYLIKGNTAIRYGLTMSAQKEIVSFDRNGSFEPGAYQLTTPAREYGRVRPRGPHKVAGTPKRYRHVTENIRTSLLQV